MFEDKNFINKAKEVTNMLVLAVVAKVEIEKGHPHKKAWEMLLVCCFFVEATNFHLIITVSYENMEPLQNNNFSSMKNHI